LAEDLVQDTLARTLRAWPRLQHDHPEAYARRVMYHLQVSRWRRRRVSEVLPGELPEPGYRTDAVADSVQRLAIRRALMNVTAQQRAVVVLRYFEDRTETETANLLGLKVGTVKSHASRALASLRVLLPDLNGTSNPRGTK